MCAATNCCDPISQAATFDVNQENLIDTISNSLKSNLNSCDYSDVRRLNNISKRKLNQLFLHLNISSLRAHFDDLCDLLSQFDQPPCIILISETRINNEPSTNITIPGYTFVHSPSLTKAGGVGAYVSDLLNFTINDTLKLNVNGCEDLWLNVTFSNIKSQYVFGVIYRHPHNNHSQFYNALDESLQILNRGNKNVIVMGDININMIGDQNSTLLQQYLKTLESNGFTCCIDQPTRIGSSSRTAIDHIVTNITRNKITPGILEYHISDHLPIFCLISSLPVNPLSKNVNTTYRNISNVEEETFREDLHFTIEPILDEFMTLPITPTNFDTQFNNLIANIEVVIDKHAPLQTISRKWRRFSLKPWLTKGIITSIKNKQKLYRTLFLAGNTSEKKFFKIYANKLTRVKNLSKKQYYTEYLSKHNSNPKKVWEKINSLLPRNNANSTIKNIKVDNKVVDNSFDIAQEFNKYFVEIGNKLASNVNHQNRVSHSVYLKNRVLNTIVMEPPTATEIHNLLISTNPLKACGCDNISNVFLRIGAPVLAPILAIFFGKALDLGIFPQIFKTAKVVPIFKSGCKEKVGNYRPIALLPSLSKILEKLIKSRFTKFFCKNKVLYSKQYGFRENHSVIHALLDILTNAYDEINNKLNIALIFMDFRKAFDTVSHEILLHKLYHYGIRGPAYLLIENYLYNRQQFVTINNTSSTLRPINIGVPQGSILGPLLFLIYINDLPNALSNDPRLFADDACLFLAHTSPTTLEKICTNEVSRLKDWCSANKIQINPQKSFVLPISYKLNAPCSNINLPFEKSKITSCQTCRYLGVLLDNQLNFKPHILLIETKLARAIGILSKLRHVLPVPALRLLYFSLIHPHLTYALPIWGCTYPSYLKNLQRLQNKSVRVIYNLRLKTPLLPYYHKLNVLKITDLYTYEIGKIMHQHSCNALPNHLSSFFTSTRQIHNRFTRSSSNNLLYLPKFSTSRCQKSIKFQGTKIWNSIPANLQNLPFYKFKNSFKWYLLDTYC